MIEQKTITTVIRETRYSLDQSTLELIVRDGLKARGVELKSTGYWEWNTVDGEVTLRINTRSETTDQAEPIQYATPVARDCDECRHIVSTVSGALQCSHPELDVAPCHRTLDDQHPFDLPPTSPDWCPLRAGKAY